MPSTPTSADDLMKNPLHGVESFNSGVTTSATSFESLGIRYMELKVQFLCCKLRVPLVCLNPLHEVERIVRLQRG